MAEAAAQFQKGLDQLALLPDTPERQRQELEFWSASGAVLHAVKGYAAPETGQAYARARELWEKLGSPSEFLQLPYGQSLYHVVRGELDLAQRLDEDLLRLSHQRNRCCRAGSWTPILRSNSLPRGQVCVIAVASGRGACALRFDLPRFACTAGCGSSPRSSQAYLGNVLYCLGFPDQALAQSNAAIAEARRLAHLPSLAVSLVIAPGYFHSSETTSPRKRADAAGCGDDRGRLSVLGCHRSNLCGLGQG